MKNELGVDKVSVDTTHFQYILKKYLERPSLRLLLVIFTLSSYTLFAIIFGLTSHWITGPFEIHNAGNQLII